MKRDSTTKGSRDGVLLLAMALLVLACPGQQQRTSLPELPGDPGRAAKVVFEQSCARCHGETGAGDGPAAAELWEPPPSFRDPKWQASVSDERIEDAIVRGGEAVGRSRWMPAYPELAEKPEVVAALRRRIRAYGR